MAIDWLVLEVVYPVMVESSFAAQADPTKDPCVIPVLVNNRPF